MTEDDFGITYMEKYEHCGGGVVWVRVGWCQIDGKNKPWFRRSFSYLKHGGKENAVTMAREYRDRKVIEFDLISKKLNINKKVPYYTGLQKNNKTGRTGVHITDYITLKDGRLCHYREAIGTITINGKKYELCRSCRKYGDEEAVRLCSVWRARMEKLFKHRKNVRFIKNIQCESRGTVS